jgi:hypothetical protein
MLDTSPLYGDRSATLFDDLRNYAVGALFAGGVIHYDGCALRGQALGNARANPLGRTRDHRDLVV